MCSTTPADHALISTAAGVEWLDEPVEVRGEVQRGLGRGSRQLGTPTANLAGSVLDGVCATERDGVYIGFGVVPSQSVVPVKMVSNIGRNQTFDDVPSRVIEAHLMDSSLAEEFYGAEMRLLLVGFLRPEVRFDGIAPLVANIRNDVAVAMAVLDEPQVAPLAAHPSLVCATEK
jgi:riboflavin kinase